MYKFSLLAILLLSSFSYSFAQLMPYQIYTVKGKKTKFKRMVKKLKKADVILFGELHNNSIIHWLQLETAKALNDKGEISLGFEMLETDDQANVNAYLQGAISQDSFIKVARVWPNYATDYSKLVNYAKENKLTCVASNIPRRYASQVYKQGITSLDTLPTEDKQWIVPLPMPFDSTLSQYAALYEMMGDHGGGSFARAQAIKDATMASSILKNLKSGKTFLHFNGAYHSDYFQGIMWYLQKHNPDLKIMTISTVLNENIKKLDKEERGKADYIIVIDEDVVETY